MVISGKMAGEYFIGSAEPDFDTGSLLAYLRIGLDAKAFLEYPLMIEKRRMLCRPPGGLPIAAEEAQFITEIIYNAAKSYHAYVPRLR